LVHYTHGWFLFYTHGRSPHIIRGRGFTYVVSTRTLLIVVHIPFGIRVPHHTWTDDSWWIDVTLVSCCSLISTHTWCYWMLHGPTLVLDTVLIYLHLPVTTWFNSVYHRPSTFPFTCWMIYFTTVVPRTTLHSYVILPPPHGCSPHFGSHCYKWFTTHITYTYIHFRSIWTIRWWLFIVDILSIY